MLLEGKRFLITGVLTPQSIAFAAARSRAGAGRRDRAHELRPDGEPHREDREAAARPRRDVLELDVNEPEHVARVRDELAGAWGSLDGFLHAIAFAPQDALGGNFLNTPWESVATAFRTSAFSLKALAVGMLPLMEGARAARSSSLDFDATRRLADLRLDGRREGRARVGHPLPRPRPRPARASG